MYYMVLFIASADEGVTQMSKRLFIDETKAKRYCESIHTEHNAFTVPVPYHVAMMLLSDGWRIV